MSESLITKLEQAEQGSRELDVAIWHFVETRFQRSDQEGWSIVPRGNRTVKDDVFAPHYTTSLDCALTLVPEGQVWEVHSDGYVGVYINAEAMSDSEKGHVVLHDAGNPVLALCIASLKARA